MRNWFCLLLALLAAGLLGGCRTGAAVLTPQGGSNQPGVAEAGELNLTLGAQAEGSQYRLVLSAPNASDLYQVGGTLVYDPQRYEIDRVEAGGGLGTPQNSYLVNGEKTPGRLGFAYTKRFAGPGANGQVSLLHFVVIPRRGRFQLADFTLATADAPLKARDSKKHDFRVTVTRGAVQP
jgi:hypothetical protein